MAYRQEVGARGEQLAEQYLRREGYTIVERNYRCPLGELDLIAIERDTIVFVEVKSRHGDDFHPLEAVNRGKQRQIIRASQYYLRRHRLLDRYVRFDIVAIIWRGEEAEIELVRDAFWLP